ncbi:MAG TPA: carboxypeptidase regulatory-like domain-containing protein, partial [Chroococcales cyanobacterium]
MLSQSLQFRLVRIAAVALLLTNAGLTPPAVAAAPSDLSAITLQTPAKRPGTALNKLLNSSAASTFVSQSVVPLQPPTPGTPAAPKPVAQSSIGGKITNTTTEQPIGDARVVLQMVGQEHKRFQTQTKEDGSYSFNHIEAGQYQITVGAKDMFSTDQYLDLKDGEAKTLNLALDDVEPVDILRLTGKRTLIHPEKIGSETNVDHNIIYQYKSGNDLRQLIESTPGVMNDSFGNVITRGEHNAINYEIDGVVLPESAGVLQQSQFVSPRSLQSMKVDIGGYEAQDGGGPLGAVAHLKSLPILSKPTFSIGQQIGGPLAGSIYYNASGAFSQKDDFWNKLRFESSGSIRGTSYRLAAPVKYYVNNNGFDVNILNKLEYLATARDTFKLTAAINETYTQIPTSAFTRSAGFHGRQHDGQDYLIASYNHKFDHFFDELDLHILNGIYYQNFQTSNAFDPTPDFNNGQPLDSIAATGRRFNYVFSAQGNLTKNIKETHHFKTGFLTELRPVHTLYNATYYNADLLGSLQAQNAARAEINQDLAAGNATAAAAVNPNPLPFGAVISPFTGLPGGPQFQGNIGKYNGFRWLQSAYLQDRFTPQNGIWKRLTLDAGLRFDL